MARGMNEIPTDDASSNDIESYRRLVELQKKIIELAQYNAHTKMACAQLRERMAADKLGQSRPARKPQPKTDETLIESPTELPADLAKPDLMPLMTKQLPAC